MSGAAQAVTKRAVAPALAYELREIISMTTLLDTNEQPALHSDPIESAEAAGLRYVSDTQPGIRRVRVGDGFEYIGSNGKTITNEKTLARIKSLAIPPAYTDVWISPQADGHIQATGRDAKGRKQYRYHPRWRQVRDETKYDRMMAFGAALPKIRERVDRDLNLRGLPHDKVVATVVRLLETTFIRVGNEEYAQSNDSYGLTTLRDDHVEIEGSKIAFTFRGKSGKDHNISITDRKLARIVKQARDIPGQELFQYIDAAGEHRTIGSADVNTYLREITGQDFTAKDFRTWAGTLLAAMALQEFEKFDTQTQAKKNVVQAIESVAKRLGNTPSVCRKCYVHPAVIEMYIDGTLGEAMAQKAATELSESLAALPPEEAAVMAVLHERLSRTA